MPINPYEPPTEVNEPATQWLPGSKVVRGILGLVILVLTAVLGCLLLLIER